MSITHAHHHANNIQQEQKYIYIVTLSHAAIFVEKN
jgi:hypothetical protein